ncbi:Hypothetical predicted protein [Pelobates cultripes]|uniref:Selenoprotein O n=1 Tax=Pelobates cultripes TaxID=61616 RepID=A0AAD1RU40_PELCU|nr:Hypothetical predicted protein [Pelobates cultripes]
MAARWAGSRYFLGLVPRGFRLLLAAVVMRRVVSGPAGRSLASLQFDNLALRSLPVEAGEGTEEEARRSRSVPGACFSRVRPSAVSNPRVVALSRSALALLGLPEGEEPGPEVAEFLSGNRVFQGAEPAAHCYCGHQFGSFAGQLGDGAAMYLGEVLNPAGERWEIQLKGAGLTPFSRQADGRKVLRSSIREFLCSEAVHHLGIPTTRAGSCVTSDSTVTRDIFYDGNPKEENCTIVLRIAPTFLRFGSFEIFKETDEFTGRRGPSVNRNDIRIQMIDYVISTFYPDIQNTHAEHKIERNAAFFREITRRTARLVAEWQCVGFCHGVLNTDNMSIVGITIDYGPYGFMDRYDPDHICNGSDNMGRYAYNKQPEICKWNLGKLAESLVPELPVEISQSIIDEEYDSEFQRWYMQKMRKKLGLIQAELEEDSSLISDLLETMNKTGADFTNTFRVLSKYAGNSVNAEDFLDILTEQCASLDELKVVFKPKMDPRQLSVMLMLAQSNPQLFALIGTKANISKELDRIERYNKLQESSEDQLLSNNRALWGEWLRKYSTRLSKDQATTGDNDTFVAERVKIMDSNNPAFVLRNYIAQNAIDAAEKGDFSEVQRVLKMLENPYDVEVSFQQSPDEAGDEDHHPVSGAASSSCTLPKIPYTSKPPPWASELCVT